ncbi:MAG: NAD(P)H-hydrate dehydratase [Candidatus Angelobacter sp.]
MKIVTAEEMRAIDRATTEKYGIPSLTLMENAGAAVADFAQKHFDFQSVCVVCGKGNNGGDGFVAARKLYEAGKKVSVIILAANAEALRGDAAEMFKKLLVNPFWIAEETDFEKEIKQSLRSELIVDAILGTGFKPPIEGLARKAVEIINTCKSPVLSVDIPSGAYSDSFLPAKAQGLMAQSDGVITFTAPRPAHVFGQVTQGPIAVASIGSPRDLLVETKQLNLEVIVLQYLNILFGRREPDAHKGNFGHILVIGGSVGKAGAAAMAGMAALHSGAGLVTVACPKSIQPTVASFAPEIMTEAMAETEAGTLATMALDGIEKLVQNKDVVVLGPGLSRHKETDELVHQLLPKLAETRLVVDADGLNAFAECPDKLRSEGLLILTPHPGEMARLTGEPIAGGHKDRIELARKVAKQHQAIIVLKGHRTVTASPGGTVWINMSGNPGMAKGGSGDVLSGIIATSQTQMQSGFGMRTSPEQATRTQELMRRRDQGGTEAQRELEEMGRDSAFYMLTMFTASAVYLHGLAGDVARELFGETSMVATNIIECIGEALDIARKSLNDELLYLQR